MNDYRDKLAELMLERKRRNDEYYSPEDVAGREADLKGVQDRAALGDLAAGLSRATSKIGTVGGKAAETGGVQEFADRQAKRGMDRLAMQRQEREDEDKKFGVDAKVYDYLAEQDRRREEQDYRRDRDKKEDEYRRQSLDYKKQKDAADRALKERMKQEKPATDSQLQAGGFAKRAEAADAIARGMVESGYDPSDWTRQLKDNALTRRLGVDNYVMSDQDQEFMQAQRDFVSAVLRKESGAAIPPEEMDNEIRKYFPLPGDGPGVIKQKAAARERAIATLRGQAGRGYDMIADVPVGQKDRKPDSGTAFADTLKTVKVTNGEETLIIPIEDLEEAQKDGYRTVGGGVAPRAQ